MDCCFPTHAVHLSHLLFASVGMQILTLQSVIVFPLMCLCWTVWAASQSRHASLRLSMKVRLWKWLRILSTISSRLSTYCSMLGFPHFVTWMWKISQVLELNCSSEEILSCAKDLPYPLFFNILLPARNTFVELVKVLLSCSSLALLKLSQGSYFDIGCFSLRFCSVLAPDHFKRKVKPLNTDLRVND